MQLTDSLAVADTLAQLLADTLVSPPPSIWDAEGVYGAWSEPLATPFVEVVATPQPPLTGNPWFQIIGLAVVCLYLLVIYYYRGQALVCLKAMFTLKIERRFGSEHGHLYNKFIASAVTFCSLTLAIALSKVISVWVSPGAVEWLGQWAMPLICFMLWAMVAVIMTVQWGLLNVAGNFTFSGEFTDAITEIKNTHLSTATLFVTPPVLLWSGINPVWDSAMMWSAAAVAGMLVISFVFRTFLLFVGQKVSLLVWILYLCTVEIFPVALVWTLVVKFF
jgi:hypothetical protein